MTTVIFLIMLALATTGLARYVHLQREERLSALARTPARPARSTAARLAPQPRRPAPALDLDMPGWDRASAASTTRPSAGQVRIRDRYIAARFPGAMRNAADLASPLKVIDVARLYSASRSTTPRWARSTSPRAGTRG